MVGKFKLIYLPEISHSRLSKSLQSAGQPQYRH